MPIAVIPKCWTEAPVGPFRILETLLAWVRSTWSFDGGGEVETAAADPGGGHRGMASHFRHHRGADDNPLPRCETEVMETGRVTQEGKKEYDAEALHVLRQGRFLRPYEQRALRPERTVGGPRPSGTKTCPSHIECNKQFSEDNDYFRLVMASDEDSLPHDEALRVLEGPITKMMVEAPGRYLRHAKDFAFRSRFSSGGVYQGEHGCFPIDFLRINRVLQNVVKGLFYTTTGKPLGPDRDILVYREEESRTETVEFFQSKMGHWCDFGDMVFTWRQVFKEGMEDMACIMQFYRRKMFFAMTKKKKPTE